jgi:hypothetical protein
MNYIKKEKYMTLIGYKANTVVEDNYSDDNGKTFRTSKEIISNLIISDDTLSISKAKEHVIKYVKDNTCCYRNQNITVDVKILGISKVEN